MSNIREEMTEVIEKVRSKQVRAFFDEKLHRDETHVYGYVPYNLPSRPINEGKISFQEFIVDGAFTDSLKNDDIELRYAHGELVLARTGDRTLRLKEDKTGIKFRGKILDHEVKDSIVDAIDAGELVGASIGFHVSEEKWEGNTRYVTKGRLVEISLVEDAAYPAATTCGKTLGTKRSEMKEVEKPRKPVHGLAREPKIDRRL